MKSTSAGLSNHLAGTVTTLATLWKITRVDGVSLHFTDHDRNIEYGGDTYAAASGYKRTAIANNVSLSVGNVDVEGVFNDAGLTEEELRVGLYDYADIYMMTINWANTADGVLKLRRGKLGEVTLTPQGFYQAELRGLSQLLSQNMLESYTAECRVDVGSTKCKIPILPAVLGRSAAVSVGEFYRVPTKTLTGVDWAQLGRNMGFEIGTAGTGKTSIEGWTVLTGTWNLYASNGGLSPDSGGLFLSGGGLNSSMEQIITLEDIGISTAEIDAGNATADFSIKRANQTAILDTGRVIVQFRSEAGAILGTPLDTGSEAITPEDTWVTRSFTGTAIPVGTRSVRILLSTTRISGSFADTAFDSAQLTVHETARTNTFHEIYENRVYEVTTAGTTDAAQPAYDTVIGNPTTDGTAILTARDAWTRHASVSETIDNRTVTIEVSEARDDDGWFEQGAMIFESSKNAGKVNEIREWTQATSRLVGFLPPPFEVQPGAKCRIYPGCDKRAATCTSKFSNIINFRGEPFIPGQDEFARFADVR